MAMDAQNRPPSVFALQKELSRPGARSYTKLSVTERMRMQLDNMVADAVAPKASTVGGAPKR
jgi:hypothetical protein